MTLLASISGIRGTIGGPSTNSLNPTSVVKYTIAFGSWVLSKKGKRVVLGRDARLSGKMLSTLISSTLMGMGIDVIDVGLSTTPTVALAVPMEQADGGIVVTASHNPENWNALKMLNNKGECISEAESLKIISSVDHSDTSFAQSSQLGRRRKKKGYIKKHIDLICAHKWVDKKAIRNAKFRIVVDGINSTGGIAVPLLLKKLGVSTVKKLHCDPTGKFSHPPEPLPEHLTDICKAVKKGYDMGIVVDPDVDRLALIMENGVPLGEDYTLVVIADYILKQKKGNTVSNLSSTQALADVTRFYGGKYAASAVGEVNVVKKMKETNAVIGGEGNGGVILPSLHYGRDALIGIALFLSYVAHTKKRLTKIRLLYPNYHIIKDKIKLDPSIPIDEVLTQLADLHKEEDINTVDGLKISFKKTKEWVHLRRSNTEPLIRIYVESPHIDKAKDLSGRFIQKIKQIINDNIAT